MDETTCKVENTLYHPKRYKYGKREGEPVPCADIFSRGLCYRHYRIALMNDELEDIGAPDKRRTKSRSNAL